MGPSVSDPGGGPSGGHVSGGAGGAPVTRNRGGGLTGPRRVLAPGHHRLMRALGTLDRAEQRRVRWCSASSCRGGLKRRQRPLAADAGVQAGMRRQQQAAR